MSIYGAMLRGWLILQAIGCIAGTILGPITVPARIEHHMPLQLLELQGSSEATSSCAFSTC